MARSRINVREFIGQRRGGRAGRAASLEEALQPYWDAIMMIPAGRVMTYGEVARLAGFPGRARQAGRALKLMPAELELHWHRVLGAGGRIVFPAGSRQYREQARRLRAEGVEVTEGRVAAEVFWEG
jgi:methylated-DNA-protein-cysteine methyltransferase related protein